MTDREIVESVLDDMRCGLGSVAAQVLAKGVSALLQRHGDETSIVGIAEFLADLRETSEMFSRGMWRKYQEANPYEVRGGIE